MSTIAAQKQEEERQRVQKDCVWEAAASGGKAAAWAGLCSASTIGLANHFSEGFRHALGVSGKAALVVSPYCHRHCLCIRHAGCTATIGAQPSVLTASEQIEAGTQSSRSVTVLSCFES